MHVLKRLCKWVVGLLILLLVLGALGAVALTKWVNPNDFKPQIVTMIDQQTGRHLTLTGNLSWNFFPRLGVHMGAAALSNPAGFSQVNFVQISSADLYLSWPALLHGEIAVSSLNIDGLQVFLRQIGRQNNWTFALPQAPVHASTSKASPAHQAIDFSMDALSITNAQVTYDNDQTKTHLVVSNLNVAVNQFSLSQSFPIAVSGTLNLDDSLSGHFNVAALCAYNSAKSILYLSQLAVQSNLSYLNNASQTINFSTQLSGDVVADLEKQTLALTGMSFDLDQIVNGNFNVQVKNWGALNYTGDLSLNAFSVPDLANSLGMHFPVLPNKLVLQAVQASAHVQGNLQKLSVNPIKLSFGPTHMQAAVNVTSFQPLRLGESISADQLDAADFVNLAGARLPMQNLAVSGTLTHGQSLSVNQNVSVQDIQLQGFDLQALINQINQIVTNLLNVRNVLTATGQINQSMQNLQANQGGIHAGNGQQTDLGTLKANIVLDHGLLTTPVMQIKGPLVDINGSGQVDLNQQTINYILVSKLVAPGKIQGLVIPYKLSGPLNKMQQGVEWPLVQAQIVKYLSVALSSAVTQSVGSVVGGAVNALKGLLAH